MLANILGEVGILYTVLLGVYSRISVPIFYRNWFIFDKHRAKNMLAHFLETWCILNVILIVTNRTNLHRSERK